MIKLGPTLFLSIDNLVTLIDLLTFSALSGVLPLTLQWPMEAALFLAIEFAYLANRFCAYGRAQSPSRESCWFRDSLHDDVARYSNYQCSCTEALDRFTCDGSPSRVVTKSTAIGRSVFVASDVPESR